MSRKGAAARKKGAAEERAPANQEAQSAAPIEVPHIEGLTSGTFMCREPMRMTSLKAPFNKLVGQVPPEALETPSMMSVQERRFLYGVASRYYEGAGLIVDAGIFLGASTRCFGHGLDVNSSGAAARKRFGKPVVSFERGIVNPGMPAFFLRNKVQTQAQPGESFEKELKANVAPVTHQVDLRIGDILETGAVDHPVEILFLDVLKMTEIADFVVREYFTKLIPGRSIVIQQDYFYERLPFIKTYQEYFREHFIYLGEIGSSAAFLCTSPIPPEEPRLEERLDPATQLELASIAMQRSADPTRRFMMALSKLRLIRKLQGAGAAKVYLEMIRGDFPEQIDLGEQLPRLREAWRSAQLIVRSKADLSAAADESHDT